MMNVIDPVAFEEWIGRRFQAGGALNGGNESIASQEMMVNAVMDPQVIILSRAIAETGVDETHARMTIALLKAFFQPEVLRRTAS